MRTEPVVPVANPALLVAARAARISATRGLSLLSILAWYVREGRQLKQAPTMQVCIEEFLWSKKNAHRRPATMDEYRSILTRFAERFGDCQPSDVTTQGILEFLQPWTHPVSRAKWFQVLSTLFEWMRLKKYACDNPIATLAKPPRPAGRGSWLTPAEARELLRRARTTDQLGYWILSLFAGMRPVEIKRLQEYALPWSLVRLSDNVIEIPAEHSKTARRVIQIAPVLRHWLLVLQKQGGAFYPSSRTAPKIGRLRRAVLRKFRGQRGLAGAFNLGRRSYISYRLALPQASYAEIAAYAGNSERMIRKYYRRAATQADALAYFRLTPDRVPPYHA